MNEFYIYDAIIIGSGIAGLSSGIMLKEAGFEPIILTKSSDINETNTNYAQGGIIAFNKEDDAKSLSDDILKAGSYYNSKEIVDFVSKEGPKFIFEFLIDKIGVKFDKSLTGAYDYTEEAAHSHRRILHYKDQTGKSIQEALLNYAKKIGITILTEHTAIDLITNKHHSEDCQELYKEPEVMGVFVFDSKNSCVKKMLSHKVILATGGLGNLYLHSTNPEIAIGDGLSMAYRAGADIINSEFIQFHPTSLYHRDIKRFLITEALRGEGAKLLNPKGEFFMKRYTPKEELDSRDIVARAIFEEMRRVGSEYMLLDAANFYKGKIPLSERFYSIYKTCLSGGIDITKEPIPIVPAAHYFCGGIRVDINARTNIKNLYAVGETSCTGLHGANRLASTSLLEAVIFSKSIKNDFVNSFDKIEKTRFEYIPDWQEPSQTFTFDPILIKQDFNIIQSTMWNYAGIIRTIKGLERAQADLNYYAHRIFQFYKESKLNKEIIELRNAVISAQLIVNSALHNKKSIGCHYIKEE